MKIKCTILSNNWFKQKTQSADTCWEKLKGQKGLKELAQVPLLLALLCITYEEQLDFPPSRSELYKDSIEALLKKWDSTRNIYRGDIYKGLSLRRKETLFSHVAYLSFDAGKYFLPKKELISLISTFMENIVNEGQEDIMLDSEAVLKAIIAQHGLFVPRAKDIYSFSHLSFSEYFAARYVVDGLSSSDQEAFIQQHFGKDKWQEVFLMSTEIHLRADHFLLSMKAHIDQFARERNLTKWLSKVDQIVEKSSVVQGGQGRTWCIFIDRALALAHVARARAHVDLALALARALALNLDLDLEFDRARAHDLDLDLGALDRASALAVNLKLAYTLNRFHDADDHADDRAHALARARDRARDLALALALDLDLDLDLRPWP